MKIAITGTPGTGKTTLARNIARLLRARLVEANEVVEESGAYKMVRGEREADLTKLRASLVKLLKGKGLKLGTGNGKRKSKNFVVEGHLLCEFKLPVDRIIVLRCDPSVLQRRLKARGYAASKVAENVLAEALDYCSARTAENYGRKAAELDNTEFVGAGKALEAAEKNGGARVRWLEKMGAEALMRLAKRADVKRGV